MWRLGFYHLIYSFIHLGICVFSLSFPKRAELLGASTKEKFPGLLGTTTPLLVFLITKNKEGKPNFD